MLSQISDLSLESGRCAVAAPDRRLPSRG
ncbi:hypothetical protein E2C01_068076 [Portunus trituberculatus]|uniref:Uncharacterized protein n=1 Tax=Portunus trituberculatus TaxID=210409 RepID=A0A5B7HVL8_PORTR|nr:hypothetical protein [Portunus trituberculatus]